MSRYFRLQCKRILRFLPGVLVIITLLAGCLAIIPGMILKIDGNKEENKKFSVALCGETEDEFLQMTLSAVSTLDSSRFTLEILQTSEAEAQKALQKGSIAAYVVFPEGFMDAAYAGELLPLKMVSTTGNTGLSSMLEEELTHVIGILLSNSEKGVFGLDYVINQHDIQQYNTHINNLTIEYVDHILVRDCVYRVDELGIADGLDLKGTLICGLSVVLALFCCLTFASLYINPDPALNRLLRAKGFSGLAQTLCEFSAYALSLLLLAGLLLPIIGIFGKNAPVFASVLKSIPVVLTAAAYSFMLFKLADNLMTGILMQFFLSLALCFVSDCLYPIQFFPVTVQKIAAWLPTGLARTQLASCIIGNASTRSTLALCGYCIVFLTIATVAHCRKIRGVSQ